MSTTPWALRTVTPSTALPVTLAELKDHLRLDHNHEDGLLYQYLRAEASWLEQIANRALLTQTLDLHLASWPATASAAVRLPRPPLQAVTSVAYTTAGSTADYGATLSSTAYRLTAVGRQPALHLRDGQNWPTASLAPGLPIRVRYTAGYGTEPADVPEPLRLCLAMGVGDHMEHREASEQSAHAVSQATRDAQARLYGTYRAWEAVP